MVGSLGAPEPLAVPVVALVLLGPGRLPLLGKSLAQGIRVFKNVLREPGEIPARNSEKTPPSQDNSAKFRLGREHRRGHEL